MTCKHENTSVSVMPSSHDSALDSPFGERRLRQIPAEKLVVCDDCEDVIDREVLSSSGEAYWVFRTWCLDPLDDACGHPVGWLGHLNGMRGCWACGKIWISGGHP
jgi:hypothetical protein